MNRTPPPVAVTLIQWLVGLPGALVWVMGVIVAPVIIAGFFMAPMLGGDPFRIPAAVLGILAAVTLGYSMLLVAGNITGDPQYRFASSHLRERFLLDTAVDYSAIFAVGTFGGALISISIGHWAGLVGGSASALLFSIGLRRATLRRSRRKVEWEKEIKAMDRMVELSKA